MKHQGSRIRTIQAIGSRANQGRSTTSHATRREVNRSQLYQFIDIEDEERGTRFSFLFSFVSPALSRSDFRFQYRNLNK